MTIYTYTKNGGYKLAHSATTQQQQQQQKRWTFLSAMIMQMQK